MIGQDEALHSLSSCGFDIVDVLLNRHIFESGVIEEIVVMHIHNCAGQAVVNLKQLFWISRADSVAHYHIRRRRILSNYVVTP